MQPYILLFALACVVAIWKELIDDGLEERERNQNVGHFTNK